MGKEILDLKTVVDRDTIRIRTKKNPAGKLYEMLNFDELGPYELAMIGSAQERAQELTKTPGKRLTKKQNEEVNRLLSGVVRLLIPEIEPRVLAEMEERQKGQIFQVWAARYQQESAEGEEPRRRTTGGSSRASTRSTAARRTRGGSARQASR
jgi:hypothetical protein